jgi:predicted porin
MDRKLTALAVAGAFAAPAALAQGAVQIGGTINLMYDSVRAAGGTGGPAQDMRSHDRVRDASGSNIRFTVSEDLGGGSAAFVQIESAVLANADTRNNALGAGAVTTGWGNRNSAIGWRSKAAGRFLIGVWTVHYDEMAGIEPAYGIMNDATSSLSLTQNFGAALSVNPLIGTRFSNVARWDSPNWSGFSLSLAYARPSDAAPLNLGGDLRDGRKNRAWHLAARYERGGLQARYAYLQDKDAVTGATISFGGATGAFLGAGTVSAAWKITSHRIGARYRFAGGFGAGLILDSSRLANSTNVAAASIDIKRNVWAIPLTYEITRHVFAATLARARDWSGSIGGVGLGGVTNPAIGAQAAGALAFGAETGARFVSLAYAYRFSARTNIHFSYYKITNDALARYDAYSNSSGTTAANVGADPTGVAFGVRHAF